MILINNESIDITEFSSNDIQFKIAKQMQNSETVYTFSSYDELLFELNLRNALVNASRTLNDSDFSFATFRKVRVNDEFWDKTRNGGFKLKPNVSASKAITDIYENGNKYATECATAMVIVYYIALLELYPPVLFDDIFSNIYLMNWHYLDKNLRDIGAVNRYPDYFIGDRRYFDNPDVDNSTPEWQGENVIDLGNNEYYGHGVGIKSSEEMIKILNRYRKYNSTQSAFLLNSAGRPDFKKLYRILAEYYT